MAAKILLLDIETAPNKVYTWGLYDQNIGINQIIQESYVLCWSAKWLDSDEMLSDAIINYKNHYKRYPTSDRMIAKSMWKLMDEADIIVTHNGDSFDIKWLNTIFLKNDLPPVSSFKSVDTCKQLRANFRLVSNKLQFAGQTLDLGHKMKHEGFELWPKCMRGEEKPFARMVKYCMQDVRLLEKLYRSIRPFIKNHPNVNLYEEKVNREACPNCGSTKVQRRGRSVAKVKVYQRLKCQNCGVWFRGDKEIKKGDL